MKNASARRFAKQLKNLNVSDSDFQRIIDVLVQYGSIDEFMRTVCGGDSLILGEYRVTSATEFPLSYKVTLISDEDAHPVIDWDRVPRRIAEFAAKNFLKPVRIVISEVPDSWENCNE